MPKKIQNRNFLSPLRFDFSIDRLPNVDFFVQSANIPGISIAPTTNAQGTPFSNIPWQGDKIMWDDLTVEFKIDEKLNSWFDVYSWMIGIGFPESTDQYKALKEGVDKDLDEKPREVIGTTGRLGYIYGQGLLLIRDSQNNEIATVKFQDVYPISLSEVKFDTRDESVNEITCSVTFKYDYYKVQRP